VKSESTTTFTDDEIERAVSSTTPTATAAPAPAVLAEMRAAMRRERRAQRARRLCRVVTACGIAAGYVALALSIVCLVTR
jgi:hypothetical protein